MKRLVIAALCVLATGCTPRERALWLSWWEQDPDAAVAWLHEQPVPATIESRYGVAVWDDIAWCESGGRWDYPPVTNRSGTYSGGLMIWNKAWVQFDGTDFAPLAYQATKAEQIIVAERIADEVGLDDAWQCWP